MTRPITILLYLTAALLGFGGCHRQPGVHTICLMDISRSIERQSIRDEFAAADRFVDRMSRGDELDLVPITGDARNELQGHVLHLRAPTERQSFDTDLTAFRADSHKQIAGMAGWAFANPPRRTDILGTLDFALQDVGSATSGRPRLIILSDFLEEDGALDFNKDPRLVSVATAKTFADSLAKHSKVRCSCPIYLGRLRSNGRHGLSRRRQDAVDAFWTEFLGSTRNPTSINNNGAEVLGG